MTLLITVFAAVISTAVWYTREPGKTLCTGTLCYMYWGASLMWLVDAVFEYAELKVDYFTPAPVDMLYDAFLGLSVVALGLVIWIVILLIKDPKGSVKSAIMRNKKD
ncbi:MAG: hypothetical protein ACI4N4_05970 [Candidatus Fimenecus sp.]